MADEFTHDPQAVLDYSIDWAPWLLAGETLTSAVWTLPDGLTRPPAHATDVWTSTVATVWVQGGVASTNYVLRCHIVTSQGREEDHSITLKCREK